MQNIYQQSETIENIHFYIVFQKITNSFYAFQDVIKLDFYDN